MRHLIVLNLFMLVVLSLSDSVSRISNGLLYPRKRFVPSKKEFLLGLHQSRDRLRCIKLCQDFASCETVTYDRSKHECSLFSEHVRYGSGRLIEVNNDNLVTIRLDKDSLKNSHSTKRKEQPQSTTLFPAYRKSNEDGCDNCEL